MITAHHLENSRSQRVLWLLEELGVENEIEHYKRDTVTRLAPPELQKLHPLGKSPIVTDDDVTIAESGAIIEYLVGKYDDGKLRPPEGSAERLTYTYWMHYAEGTFAAGLPESPRKGRSLRIVTDGLISKISGLYLSGKKSN